MTINERKRLLWKRRRCVCGHTRVDHVAGLGRIDCIGSMECECRKFVDAVDQLRSAPSASR